MKYSILLPVETSSRELIYKLFLAKKFALHNFDVFIGSKKNIWEMFDEIQPFIYFDKGYHENISENSIYKKVKDRGFLINLDEEGGVDFSDFHTLNRRFPKLLFDYSNIIFLWGKQQYNFLKKNRNNFDENKVFVSGHPRFELLKDKYCYLYQNEVKTIKNKFRKFILINSNTKYANHINGEEFLYLNYGHRVKSLKSRIDYDIMKFNVMNSLIKTLASELDYNIVIRPHPEEKIQTYMGLFSDYKNVHTLYEYNAIPWILACEALIHYDCTTAVEAFFLGKTAIAYAPNINMDLSPVQPLDISVKVGSESDVLKLIKQNDLFNPTSIQKQVAEEFFSWELHSNDIIVEEVVKMVKSSNQQFKEKEYRYSFLLNTLMDALRVLKQSVLGGNELGKNKIGLLADKKYVLDLFEKINDNGNESYPKIKKIKNELYLISN